MRDTCLEFVDFGEYVSRIEGAGAVIYALESDDAFLIDDENGAVGCAAFIVEDAIRLRHCAVRMEVRQQRIGYVAERSRVRGLGRTGVAAYAQNLGILLLEVSVVAAHRGDLVRSTTCEREYVEREDDGLLASVVAQGHIAHVLRRQREVGRGLSYIYHSFTFLQSCI